MITITLTPQGQIAKRVVLTILRFFWASFVFIVTVLFALVCFLFGTPGKKQSSSEGRKSQGRNQKLPENPIPQKPAKRLSQEVVYEPTAYVITLASDELHFREKIAALRRSGYRWHSGLNAWALPKVRLGNNHQNFEKIIGELKRVGYKWNGSCWTLYFPPSIRK